MRRPHSMQQKIGRTSLLLSIDRTDGRTSDRYYADNVSKLTYTNEPSLTRILKYRLTSVQLFNFLK